MPSGGSVSFVYGFIFCIICNICLSASVGELASLWPTAGGQYHYAYAMATKKWKKSMVRFSVPARLMDGIPDIASIELPGWMDQHCWLAYSQYDSSLFRR
jgi:amino acid transporter